MLAWALMFLIIAVEAVEAALFGFTEIAPWAAEPSQILFYVFLTLFLVTMVIGLFRGRTQGPPV